MDILYLFPTTRDHNYSFTESDHSISSENFNECNVITDNSKAFDHVKLQIYWNVSLTDFTISYLLDVVSYKM